MARRSAYLLDTTVLSETVRAIPAPQVMAWLDSLEPEQMYVSVLTLGEIRKGALKAPDTRRRDKRVAWLEDVLPGSSSRPAKRRISRASASKSSIRGDSPAEDARRGAAALCPILRRSPQRRDSRAQPRAHAAGHAARDHAR